MILKNLKANLLILLSNIFYDLTEVLKLQEYNG